MTITKEVKIEPSKLLCYTREACQGFEVVIVPKLNEKQLDKVEAEIIASAINQVLESSFQP